MRQIALELVDAVRRNATIDRIGKESALPYANDAEADPPRPRDPPDKQGKATQRGTAQAELIAKDWVA